MKKRVNGKIVDIQKYVDLFMLAEEGTALNRKASSLVRNTIESKSELVRDIVNEYHAILNDLVYPLNMIEEEIKYMTIGLILNKRLSPKYGVIRMQVSNSIRIEVEPDRVLRLLAGTWAIEATDQSYKVTSLGLNGYEGTIGYNEYRWALNQLWEGKDTSGFYKTFMLDFLAACKNEQFILNWELEHMLDFGYVPDPVNLPENKLIDIDSDMEYFLDIYSTGKRETNDTVLRLSFTKDGKSSSQFEKKKIKVYNFEAYGKSASESKGLGRTEKIQGAQAKGFSAVFDVLLTEGIVDDSVTQLKYFGIISQNQLLFEINKEIYIAPFDSYVQPKRLVSNVHLYGFESGRVYVKKVERTLANINKETIYSYEVATNKARLCKIQFIN